MSTSKTQAQKTGKAVPDTSTTTAVRRRRAGQVPASTAARNSEVSPALDGTRHVTPADGNVFADLGFPPEKATNLALRSDLMSALGRVIHGITQVEAAAMLGVTQPRVSELKRNQIDRFTIDALINMLACAGGRARLVIDEPRRTAA